MDTEFDTTLLSFLAGYYFEWELMVLPGRIVSSAYDAYAAKDYDRALRYLSWNKIFYKSFSEKDHASLLSRMVQMLTAQSTWNGMIETMKAKNPDNPAAWKQLEEFKIRAKQTAEFYGEYLKFGPFLPTAGIPRVLPYEMFIANRPLWVDTAFEK